MTVSLFDRRVTAPAAAAAATWAWLAGYYLPPLLSLAHLCGAPGGCMETEAEQGEGGEAGGVGGGVVEGGGGGELRGEMGGGGARKKVRKQDCESK